MLSKHYNCNDWVFTYSRNIFAWIMTKECWCCYWTNAIFKTNETSNVAEVVKMKFIEEEIRILPESWQSTRKVSFKEWKIAFALTFGAQLFARGKFSQKEEDTVVWETIVSILWTVSIAHFQLISQTNWVHQLSTSPNNIITYKITDRT